MGGFKSKRDEIDGNVEQAFRRSMEDTTGDAADNAPFHDGLLSASITWRMLSQSATELKATFGSALRYAAIRELGGVIRPVRAKRLVWKDYEGRFHSSREVIQKPGGKLGSSKHGKPYLKPAAENFGDHMDKHLKAAE
jgi:phage gpG-like protein